jgi:serine/threonine protein kinase
LKDFDIGPAIAKGCSAVVYSAKCLAKGFELMGAQQQQQENEDHKIKHYPLAVKMMFNFHAESNAPTILKAMKKELLLAQNVQDDGASLLKKDEVEEISPHPNIVKIYTAFTDMVPSMSDSMYLYPDALPTRLNPNGYGRNMSLFLIMKRYKTNLQKYLQENQSRSWQSSLIMLTQILEGLVHLSRYKIAHRDLKTDNILVDYNETQNDRVANEVVISDFGCCWFNPQYGFRCPYLTDDVDKGGNAALMAPEVANAVPGIFSFINYEKADVWSCGAMAYEIFGFENPFYNQSMNKKGLDSRTYHSSDLPTMTSKVPPIIESLVKSMLTKNPDQRLSAEEAATICQLLLWAPRSWTIGIGSGHLPSSQDILQWLLTMTTKTLYECRFFNKLSAHVEYQLVATVLSRLTMANVKKSLNWIKNQK